MLELAERLAERLGALWFSVVRTWVPSILGGAFAWLATRGFTLDDDTRNALIAAGTVASIMGWYLVARLAEQYGARKRWRWLQVAGGLMLGIPKPPEYAPAAESLKARALNPSRAPSYESPAESAARRAARVAKLQ